MHKLKSTSLSSSNLKDKKSSGLVELDSPIPISVRDIEPQGNTTITVLPTGGTKTKTEIRNEEFWKLILETK
jgi:hypothetical protein